eukprot:CAMPEP_0116134846 /NCGR_PEP_ID=MMETSP0329-20121206/10868_1 /TAXON_ID=697910 /ORGANISM="Pseudo-nitzschia arenysensis, Strain B593" /LENGTH=660 /DNA_ID=CAMNT_0003629593 /DNA_START=81 /DNA_END=2060 /DNA_ORIENTATION=-
MKISNLLWLSLAVAAPASGSAGLFGLWGSDQKEAEETAPIITNKTIHSMINDERRFVLYNSRKLTGECLEVCVTPRAAETMEPTTSPSLSPTKSQTKSPTEEPISEGSEPPLDCDSLGNLGAGFSEATDYDGECYPHITSLDTNNLAGHDDSVAVFVGGDFVGNVGAEVEGKMVTLGDLTVGSSGPGNFVSVGLGSQVIPTAGTDCIVVGGNIETMRDIQVYNQNPSWMHCDIVYGGNAVNPEKWKTFGEVRHEPNYDLSFYEKMMYVWKKKSEYWKTLPSTGSVYKEWSTTYYDCTDSDEIQVFNIHPNNYEVIGQPGSMDGIIFSNNCQGKTILVNVHGSGEISFNAAAMHWKNDQDDLQKGYNAGGFPTCMTESMMWNFPDASLVDIGGDCCTSEFHGSILAQGNVKMTTSGQSGRTIVLGDLTQEHGGSEFHSYQYNPPISLPDPDDICEIPEGGAAALTSIVYPTMQPTNEPTFPQGLCVRIPNEELPDDADWQTTDAKCAKCHPDNNGGPHKWYPCNKDPPLCKGNCVFNLPEGGDAAPESIANPTMQPTNEPTFPEGQCVRIPNEELPDDADWQTTDAKCAKCHPDNNGGPHKWYPCNKDPPLCKGNCVFNLPEGGDAAPESIANPTMQPTNEPTFPEGQCVRIPNEELPDDA